jgi:hypothetical protein
MTSQTKQVEIIAAGCIVISVPGGATEFAGFDENGSPITRLASREVQPGERFTVDEVEAASLLAAGAAYRPGDEPPVPNWPIRSDGEAW